MHRLPRTRSCHHAPAAPRRSAGCRTFAERHRIATSSVMCHVHRIAKSEFRKTLSQRSEPALAASSSTLSRQCTRADTPHRKHGPTKKCTPHSMRHLVTAISDILHPDSRWAAGGGLHSHTCVVRWGWGHSVTSSSLSV